MADRTSVSKGDAEVAVNTVFGAIADVLVAGDLVGAKQDHRVHSLASGSPGHGLELDGCPVRPLSFGAAPGR